MDLRSLLIARSSLRNSFRSYELSADISIALIVSTLAIKILISLDLAAEVEVTETGLDPVAAFICIGINDINRNAVNILSFFLTVQRAIF